jgi:hypothetical protein
VVKAKRIQSLLQLLTVVLLLCASGATCQRSMLVNPFSAPGPVAPEIIVEGATREQIVAAVNQNSARIQSLSVTGASITIPDTMELPLLSGNIAVERPGRFRLTAGTSFGQEVDIGSNDELFWVWVRRNQPPAVYICRLDQFATSNIRQIMPVEPAWLLAAMGIVELDPASVFEGPLPRGDGMLELRSWLRSASGTLQRVTVVDARRASVVEQHVYDEAGTTLLASAVAESHRYYPLEQVSLPDRLSIRLPASGLAFKINLGAMQINQLAGDRQQLWALPTFEGYPQHDLGGAAPGTPLPGQLGPVKNKYPVVPTSHSSPPASSYPAVSVPYTAPQTAPTQSGARPSVGSPTPGPLPRYGWRRFLPRANFRR